MAPTTVDGIEGLRELLGQEVGPSPWREVSQAMIDCFAEVSRDHQWIHVDVDRALAESPYGGPIAHGNLTLSMIDGFRGQLIRRTGFQLVVNYGWNKVRFPATVAPGCRARAYANVISLDDVGRGWWQTVTKVTVEVEGGDVPACVAESVSRLLA